MRLPAGWEKKTTAGDGVWIGKELFAGKGKWSAYSNCGGTLHLLSMVQPSLLLKATLASSCCSGCHGRCGGSTSCTPGAACLYTVQLGLLGVQCEGHAGENRGAGFGTCTVD